MLYELYAENFALLSSVRLQLGEGMNALTGETGAGKSLIVDALSLLIGGRGSDSLIRSGCDKCIIEGTFLPPFPLPSCNMMLENDISASDQLILTRELIRGGRSVARINGRTVPLSILRELGRSLVNIHGQREHTLLLEEDHQLMLLDSFGENTKEAGEHTARAYDKWQQAIKKIREYESSKDMLSRKSEDLRYIINELSSARLQQGEEEKLKAEASLLAHGEKLYAAAGGAYEALGSTGGAVDIMSEALSALRAVAHIDPKADELCRRQEDLFYEIDDMAKELAAYRDRISMDACRQEQVEERLALLGRLKKKYLCDADGLLEKLEQSKAEAEELEELSFSAENLYKAEEAARKEYDIAAARLTDIRRYNGEKLSVAITRELSLLNMTDAVFRVDLPENPPGPHGNEHAMFMIRPNVGEPFNPVAKTASGGELSRIVLGIKVILSRLDYVPTLIFDEVDTGLSGKALVSVAQRIAAVGESAQAIVVTHNAVMAAAAAHQILIEKHQEGERTVSAAYMLDDAAREKEIARMIAGDRAGEITLAQARDMLASMSRPSLF